MSEKLTPEFVSYIKKWLAYDNALKKLSIQQKKLGGSGRPRRWRRCRGQLHPQENKDLYENEIISLIQSNRLQDIKLNLSDSKITYNTNFTSQPISNKFLEETLNEYFRDEYESKKLLQFIKRKRENNKKQNSSLKRTFNKNVLEK